MPIPGETYLPFSKIAIDLGHTSYLPQWSKTATCDRLINLIYDEALLHAATQTQLQRFQALIKYCARKRSMAQEWYDFADADTRNGLRDYTYNNALIEFNEGQIGRCGRFHRALTAVWNETTNANQKKATYQIWLNNLILALSEEFNYLVPPLVAEITAYRIDNGPTILNTGADIDLVEGQKISMYTTGIGFVSSEWEVDAVPIPTETGETLTIDSVVIADTGAYINQYTNASGTTPSDPFNVVVT